MLGAVPTIQPELSGDFATLMGWADEIRRMKVRANAETPLDARTARKFGAEGIGLCRTEHMFFDADRIGAVREMIMAETEQGRRAALAKLAADAARRLRRAVPHHEGPAGHHPAARPAAARVPAEHRRGDRGGGARLAGTDVAEVRHRAAQLHETNPMLGHRGCRLGITYPGDLRDAGARDLRGRRRGHARRPARPSMPEIMIPLIAHQAGARHPEGHDRPGGRRGHDQKPAATIDYLVGTMIELPRAALLAGEIAETRRVLQLRHQRPDADHLRHLRATMPASFLPRLSSRPASWRTTRS